MIPLNFHASPKPSSSAPAGASNPQMLIADVVYRNNVPNLASVDRYSEGNTLYVNQIVLLTNQTNKAHNGLYLVDSINQPNASITGRHVSLNDNDKLRAATSVYIRSGVGDTVNSLWALQNAGPTLVLGTSQLNFGKIDSKVQRYAIQLNTQHSLVELTAAVREVLARKDGYIVGISVMSSVSIPGGASVLVQPSIAGAAVTGTPLDITLTDAGPPRAYANAAYGAYPSLRYSVGGLLGVAVTTSGMGELNPLYTITIWVEEVI